MRLSVVIPSYNAERTLGAQLESLAAQDFPSPWEVIVADNGSTDRTVLVARSFSGRLPHLRIIHAGDRRGAAHARNRGVGAARSALLAFCDADDVVGAGYVRAVCEALSKHEFIACRYEFKKLNQRWISRLPGPQLTDVDRGLLGPFSYAGGGSLAVRRNVHDAVGGFDEENFPILQDTDYCVRIQRAGVPLVFAPDAVVHYRWRTTAWRAFQQARSWGREVIALRARHWPAEGPPDTPGSLVRHLARCRRLRTTGDLAGWIWSAGWQTGSIEGWRKQIREAKMQAGPFGELRWTARFKRRTLTVAGRFISKAMSLRDRAWSDACREGFGSIHSTSVLKYPLKIDGRPHIHIGARATVSSGGWLCAVTNYGDQVFTPEIHIGDDVCIGNRCHIVATRMIFIGRKVRLLDGVYLSDNLHGYRDVDRSIADNKLVSCGEVHIEEGCCIEENVCIVGNVRIGEHCTVSANSVLTRSLPPFSVAAGIPARIVRRYNPASQQWEETAADGSFRKSEGASSEEMPGEFIKPKPL